LLSQDLGRVQQRTTDYKNQKRYEKRRAFFHNDLIKKLRLNRADTQVRKLYDQSHSSHVRNSGRPMSSGLTESHVRFVGRAREIKL
jgi:hypothetical protein